MFHICASNARSRSWFSATIIAMSAPQHTLAVTGADACCEMAESHRVREV
jgi:hypothetical protein